MLLLCLGFAHGNLGSQTQDVAEYVVKHIPPEVLTFLGWTASNICSKIDGINRSNHCFELYAGSNILGQQFDGKGTKMEKMDHGGRYVGMEGYEG